MRPPPLWLLVAMSTSGTLPMHIMVPVLPDAARELTVSNPTIQLTITLYLAGLATGQLIYGSLSDRLGRRPVLIGGMALYAVASVLCALAPTAPLLIVGRVLQALGGCSGLVLGRAIIRDVSPPREAAARLALVNLVMAVAPALAPFVGGQIADVVGWRGIFWALAAIGGLTLLCVVAIMAETRRDGGAVPSPLRGASALLRSRLFMGYVIAGSCSTTSFYAFTSESPFIFADVLHRPAAEIGRYYIIMFLGISLGGFIANRLVRRMDTVLLLTGANMLGIAGALAFLGGDLSGQLTVGLVVGSMLVFTVGAGTVSPLALTGAIGANPSMIGAASGLYGFLQMSYGAFCTLVVSVWHGRPSLVAGVVLAASALFVQVGLRMAGSRRATAKERPSA